MATSSNIFFYHSDLCVACTPNRLSFVRDSTVLFLPRGRDEDAKVQVFARLARIARHVILFAIKRFLTFEKNDLSPNANRFKIPYVRTQRSDAIFTDCYARTRTRLLKENHFCRFCPPRLHRSYEEPLKKVIKRLDEIFHVKNNAARFVDTICIVIVSRACGIDAYDLVFEKSLL